MRKFSIQLLLAFLFLVLSFGANKTNAQEQKEVVFGRTYQCQPEKEIEERNGKQKIKNILTKEFLTHTKQLKKLYFDTTSSPKILAEKTIQDLRLHFFSLKNVCEKSVFGCVNTTQEQAQLQSFCQKEAGKLFSVSESFSKTVYLKNMAKKRRGIVLEYIFDTINKIQKYLIGETSNFKNQSQETSGKFTETIANPQ